MLASVTPAYDNWAMLSTPSVNEILAEYAPTRIVCLTKPEHLERVPELAQRAKIAEYRCDLAGMYDPWKLNERLQRVSEYMPVLFTNRWKDEGGHLEMNELDRIALAEQVSPYVAAFDFEIDAPATNSMLTHAAGNQIPVIASYHDFTGVSTWEIWMSKVIKARSPALLPDWIEIAVQLDEPRELDELKRFMDQIKQNGQKIIPVGMGPFGKEARIYAVQKRLSAIYCTAEPSSAYAQVPGQLTLDEADKLWEEEGITDHPGAIAA